MVDYIVDYLDNIDARRVTPNIEPGYLQELIPTEPPQNPEDWDTIMDDVEKKIMIGVSTARLFSLFSKPIILKLPIHVFFYICFKQFGLISFLKNVFVSDDSLAAPQIPCLFSRRKFLSFNSRRYAWGCNWMCWILMGT